MEKRKPNDLSPEQCLAVDTESLCKLLDCGRHTAVQIGDLAHARITMNSLTGVFCNISVPTIRQGKIFLA